MSELETTSDVHAFETGAVRGTDANSTRYDLLSSFALIAVSQRCDPDCTSNDYFRVRYASEIESDKGPGFYVLAAIDKIGSYVDCEIEKRRLLLEATWLVLMACHIDRGGTSEFVGSLPPRGIEGYAAAMSEGALKYAPRNYELGIPVSDTTNHGLRHLWRFLDGDKSEDHLGHASWNFMTAIHMMERLPEMAKGMRWYRTEVALTDDQERNVIGKLWPSRIDPSQIVNCTHSGSADRQRVAVTTGNLQNSAGYKPIARPVMNLDEQKLWWGRINPDLRWTVTSPDGRWCMAAYMDVSLDLIPSDWTNIPGEESWYGPWIPTEKPDSVQMDKDQSDQEWFDSLPKSVHKNVMYQGTRKLLEVSEADLRGISTVPSGWGLNEQLGRWQSPVIEMDGFADDPKSRPVKTGGGE